MKGLFAVSGKAFAEPLTSPATTMNAHTNVFMFMDMSPRALKTFGENANRFASWPATAKKSEPDFIGNRKWLVVLLHRRI